MAKVLNPLNSSEARGRVGGLIYNTWRGIRTVKSHTDPAHQSDPKRQAHKNIVQAAGQRWRTITPAQRSAWDHFANQHPDIDWTGRPVRLAGFHWYVRIQVRLHDISLGYIDDPPQGPCLLRTKQFNLETTGYTIRAQDFYYDPPESDGHRIQFWISRPHSIGRKITIHDIYYHGWEMADAGAYYFEDLTIGYYTVFAREIRENGMIATWQQATIYLAGP
jgi:hypothetical protein